MNCFKGKKIHFIGVGGVGVNALARYVLDEGAEASGSDAKFNGYCKKLAELGADIYEGVNPKKIEGVDAVVYSSAIKPDNAELAAAMKNKTPVFERQEFLHAVSEDFKTVVGIAGTHGKTTTTAMTAHILLMCRKNFVAMIGGSSVDFGNYVNNNGGDIFLAEACEYKRNFLSLKPTVAVVTNVECDHPDCYSSYGEIKLAFDEYLAAAPNRISLKSDSGSVWEINCECGGVRETLCAEMTDNACVLYLDGVYVGSVRLKDGGDYDFKNATFAIATAKALGVSVKDSIRALTSFAGVARRYEFAGEIDGVPIYFDFAHHPTEIACVLKRAKKRGKSLVVFQPHTYSRTKAYFEDFVRVFGEDDSIGALIFMPTYAAREKFDAEFESDALARAIVRRYGRQNTYVAKDAASAVEFAKRLSASHDTVLFVGAGDIYDIKAAYFDKSQK